MELIDNAEVRKFFFHRVEVDGKQVDIRPDTTLVIPASVLRQVFNTGLEELVLLLVRNVVPT